MLVCCMMTTYYKIYILDFVVWAFPLHPLQQISSFPSRKRAARTAEEHTTRMYVLHILWAFTDGTSQGVRKLQ